MASQQGPPPEGDHSDEVEFDELDFEQDFPEVEEDFTEVEEVTPQPQKRKSKKTAPNGTSSTASPSNARRNTFILIGGTGLLFFLCAAWILLTPAPQQKRVLSADALLPPVNQTQGQAAPAQNSQNPDFLVNNRYGQQPAGQNVTNQGFQYPPNVNQPQAAQYPQNGQNPGTQNGAGQMAYGQQPRPYDQGQNSTNPPQGQYANNQFPPPPPPPVRQAEPMFATGQATVHQSGMAGQVAAPRQPAPEVQTQAPPQVMGQPNPAPEAAGLPSGNQVAEQLTELVQRIAEMTTTQENLIAQIEKSPLANQESRQESRQEDQSSATLKQELETLRQEKAAALAQIMELKEKVDELTGKNTFLRNEERKWRHMVEDLEKKLAAAPKNTASLSSFKGKWELRGLDPDKAIFISKDGDIREARVGDRIDGVTVNAISFAEKRVETNAGDILYQ